MKDFKKNILLRKSRENGEETRVLLSFPPPAPRRNSKVPYSFPEPGWRIPKRKARWEAGWVCCPVLSQC